MTETVIFANGKIIAWDPEIMKAISGVMRKPSGSGMYQKGNLEFAMSLIERPKIVVEVGAHIGMNTVYYSDWAEAVYAFEPLDVNYRHLQINLERKIY